MTRFSANLGLLWKEMSLPNAIGAAAKAGFDAVECHWPYSSTPESVINALDGAQLPMLGLNTFPGDLAAGDRGLLAVPGREQQARAAIDQAIEYASAIQCANVHAMAGIATGDEALNCYLANLQYASGKAGPHGINILIEPINTWDMPGYFMCSSTQAADTIKLLGCKNIKMMFDCYHIGRMEGDVASRLQSCLPIIGHIQFASVPSRNEPDQGELDYRKIFRLLNKLGYNQPLGAEYHPIGRTEDSLGWMKALVDDLAF